MNDTSGLCLVNLGRSGERPSFASLFVSHTVANVINAFEGRNGLFVVSYGNYDCNRNIQANPVAAHSGGWNVSPLRGELPHILDVKPMKKSSEFAENLREVFAEFGPLEIKSMFGGYGVFRDGLMFALVADDVLYLKADKKTAADFQDRGLPPFEYEKGGKKMSMSYFQAPEEIFDEREVARDWADLAFGAALRGKSAKAKAGRKRI